MTGQEIGCGERTRTFDSRINNLGYITSPINGCGWIRTTNLALMRRLLFPLELHSRDLWKPAEELNLVPSAQLS